MLLDLIRTLPAALLVGVLPGWFWTRVLLASEDRAERLAHTIALSIILAPAAALIPARLFGTGVTLAVTVCSLVLVFLAGLAASLAFGPAKGPERPVSRPPAPPGLPTLVPLAAALLLSLGMLSGVLPGVWPMIPVALLVIAAGIVYLRGTGRRGPPPEGPDEGPEIPLAVHYGLLSAVLLLVLARGYLGPLLNGWPFPRGIDRYEHAVMAGMLMSEGTNESFMLYPPGFHVLVGMLSRLGGIEPLDVFPILAPTLPLLAALACYALAARLWGRGYGVAAALFSGLLLGGTYEHFSEARYPNFVGEYFLIVLAIRALVGLYAAPSPRNGLLLAVLGSSVVLYHQIASYTLAVLLGLLAMLLLPYLLRRERRTGIAFLLSLALLGTLSVLYAWDTYDLGSLVAGLVGGSETGRGGDAVAMAIGTKPGNGPAHFLTTMSHPVLWLGLMGLFLLVSGRGEGRGTPDTLARVTLLAWTLLLFAGSLTSYSGFPDRFERDLGVPLALLAALALVTVLRSVKTTGSRGTTVFAVGAVAVSLAAAVVGLQAVQNLQEAAGPSARAKDRPAPPEIVVAGRWLEEHNDGGSIVVTPYLENVPSRGMLAMGGYTRMQSYHAERIRRGRDLPPFGEGPLWDALWMLKNPAGGRTERLLKSNDVRYVVFHKRYAGLDWRPFARRDDLYRVAFENDAVIIFAPREV